MRPNHTFIYETLLATMMELRASIIGKNTHIVDLQKALSDEQARSARYKSVITQSLDVIDHMSALHKRMYAPDTLLLDSLDKMSQSLRSIK